jgi:hypothetical protein
MRRLAATLIIAGGVPAIGWLATGLTVPPPATSARCARAIIDGERWREADRAWYVEHGEQK